MVRRSITFAFLLMAAVPALAAFQACGGSGTSAEDVAAETAAADVRADRSGGDLQPLEELVSDLPGGDGEPADQVEADAVAPPMCPPLPTVTPRSVEEAAAEGQFEAGEVLRAAVGEPFTLPAPEGEEQFLLVLYDLGDKKGVTHDYDVSITMPSSLAPAAFPESPALPPGFFPPQMPLPDQFGPRATPDARSELPEVGEVENFQVSSGFFAVTIEAEVMLVTDTLIIYKDITSENPLPDVDLKMMEDMAGYFQDLIQPRERFFWGQESDVNGDEHVSMLFTHLVNEYGAYAYVTQCDLMDPDVCGYGNEQELIYVAIMNPDDHIKTAESFGELVAHEFNHSIYFYRKFINNGADEWDENVYITEGMSALAQDLTGFARGNLFVASAGLSDINEVSLPDLHGGEDHAYEPTRDGALRGAGYLYLRYLFDQAGGEEMDEAGNLGPSCAASMLAAWMDSPLTGEELIEAMTGLTYEEAGVNWFTALALSNRPGAGPIDPVFSYLPVTTDPITDNQRGMDLWGSVLGMFNLTGPAVQDIQGADGTLRSGGVEYLLVTAAKPGPITIEIDTTNATAPGCRVVRLAGE